VSEPERAAATLLASWPGGVTDPPVRVDELAEEHEDLDIQEEDDLRLVPNAPQVEPGIALSGLLIPAERRIWVNRIEAARSPGRRRFTIAHELGHWRLHAKGSVQARTTYCRPDDVGADRRHLHRATRLEAEANRFAAALLMPEGLVRPLARELKLNIPALANRFEVSVPAMRIRLDSLGLLPEYMR
jgi:IrrE N-terminal-like domain